MGGRGARWREEESQIEIVSPSWQDESGPDSRRCLLRAPISWESRRQSGFSSSFWAALGFRLLVLLV